MVSGRQHAPGAPASQRDFSDDCRQAVLRLRSAIRTLYQAVEADPARPQVVSRRFGLDKNLTWKVARVLQTDDAFEAVPLIPGAEGLGLLVRAMEAAGAPAASLEEARQAANGFEEMVRVHGGDRATLELLVNRRESPRGLELARRQAFRGNRGVFGLQARLRVGANWLAPNRESPELLDFAMVAGVFGLRRLRAGSEWPIFRITHYGQPSQTSGGPRPLAGGDPADPGAWLLKEWCDPPAPPLDVRGSADDLSFILADGPLGRMGESDCVYGLVERRAFPRFMAPPDQFGELAAIVTLPLELMLMDLFVHRSMEEARSPETCLFARPFGGLALDPSWSHPPSLPFAEKLSTLGALPAGAASPELPRYQSLVAQTFERCGWDPGEFVGVRLLMPYPPMPSTVMLRYRLVEAPPSPRRRGR